MAYKNCHKYYDEFWGGKYPHYECEIEYDDNDYDEIIEKTIELVLKLYSPEYMKEVPVRIFIQTSADDGEYKDIEMDLREYIKEAIEIIKENKNEYFTDNNEYLEWYIEAKDIYKKYL